MKDWIKELCPEIAEWQSELIAEAVQQAVKAEREACARVCEDLVAQYELHSNFICAKAIRARGGEQ
jgi:hypothetical protein